MPARDLARQASKVDELGDILVREIESGDAVRILRASMYVENLPPSQRKVVDIALARRRQVGWRADPFSMHQHLEPALRSWAYVRFLANQTRKAVTGESKFQQWSMPARYGKTEWGPKRGTVFALEHDDSKNIAIASYGKDLAREAAVWVRDFLIAHEDQLTVRLRPDMRRSDRWRTTGGGGLLATGIGGSFAGFPADGVWIDDPFKNWQEAHSPVARDKVYNWQRSVARMRMETDEAWMIVLGHRMHVDDLHARLRNPPDGSEPDPWEIVELRLFAEEDDPLGRPVGQVLEPERFSEETARRRYIAVGTYLAQAMEQQNPQPEAGGEIKRAWWQWVDQPPRRFDQLISSWDMKLKDKATGDYVVGQVWGRTGGSFWCIDQLRGRYTQATTKAAIALTQIRHRNCGTHIIENTGNGPEVMAELRKGDKAYVLPDDTADELGMTAGERVKVQALMRRGLGGLVPENVKGSKLVRARASLIPNVENGHVFLPLHAAWAISLVDEAAAFPGTGRKGDHDDQVDAASQALKRLMVAEATVSTVAGRGKISTPAPKDIVKAKPTGRTRQQTRSAKISAPRRGRATIGPRRG